MRSLLRKIAQADKEFNLIQAHDKIGVGISGGKDSTLLLYALSLYQKSSRKPFEVIGIHIDLGFGEQSTQALETFFKSHDIEFFQIPSSVAAILELNKKKDKVQCSLCSKFKKAAVIKAAKDRNCTKVAFAHHADDAIETLFLNAIYGGKLATFDAKMYLSESQLTFIRPFVFVKEQEIIQEVLRLNLPTIKSGCPVDGETKRQDIKLMLKELYKTYPTAQDNFIRMLNNPSQLSLWDKSVDKFETVPYNLPIQKK